ncbi:hypothetical protein BDR04DRAFT_125811 [Suillus decipiens]|nr:hypothetical protein BDR04DRAFT_125811 [Suillus decipiens]
MVFITKLPCCLSCVLNEGQCPPCDEPHDVNCYPLYYDALYYPHLNLACFESSKSFCMWLKSSLKSHPVCCSKYHWSNFHGCISYDDASYHHCIIFCKLSTHDALS